MGPNVCSARSVSRDPSKEKVVADSDCMTSVQRPISFCVLLSSFVLEIRL